MHPANGNGEIRIMVRILNLNYNKKIFIIKLFNMNRIILISTLILTIGFSASGQTKNFIDQPYIEVNGYADTLVTPNIIYIKIVISEKDSRDKISLEEQENRMITVFKNLGINTETDLTTSDMLSNYKFYLLKQKDILKTKEYILKVTTAESASIVFVQLEDIGISNTSIHKIDHSELEYLNNICRTKAIANSHKKAIALTQSISQTIGNAIHITDTELNFDNQLQGRAVGIQIRGYSSTNKAQYEPPKIEFEKIKVTSTVSVKYILK
jgi:uncharacterized protein YggE